MSKSKSLFITVSTVFRREQTDSSLLLILLYRKRDCES